MKKIWPIFKVSVSLLLIAVILTKVKVSRVAEVLAGINFWLLLVLLLISFLLILISCLKWKLFVADEARVVKLHVLMKYYVIGYFFNNVLPSNIGGDVARTYLLGKNIKSQSESFSSVFWERFTGFIALVPIAFFAALYSRELLRTPAISISIVLMSGSLIAVGVCSVWEKPKELLESVILRRLRLTGSFLQKLERLYSSVHMVKYKRRELAKAMLYSLLFQGMAIVNTLVCCWSIGVYPDVVDVAATVPIIMMVSTIPISIGGLGLWEGSFAYFFSLIGISPVDAVTVALVLRCKNLLLGLCGGGLLLLAERAGEGNKPLVAGSRIKALSK